MTGTILGKSLWNIKFVHLIFLQLFRKQPILRRIQRDIITNVMYRYACEDFKETLILPNNQISNFMKIRQEGAKLFMWVGGRAGERADIHDEANSRFFPILCERI